MSPGLQIRRITIAVDASPASRGTLEATADLAARLGAELLGIFVEDLDLLHAAALPFSAEVDAFSAALRPVGRVEAERRLRRQAARARAILEEIAGRSQVPWTFQVLRGRVAAELLAQAAEADLMILSRGRHRRRLGSTARELLARSGEGRILLLPAERRPGGPVAVLYDGSPAAAHALEAAARLCVTLGEDGGEGLRVLMPAGETAEAELREQAAAVLGETGVPARFETLRWEAGRRLRDLERVLSARPGGLVVLPTGSWLAAEELPDFLGRLDRGVLLVR